MHKDQVLYKYPPDFKKSQIHRKANRIFKNLKETGSTAQCECCQKKVGNDDQVSKSICFSPLQLAQYGPGLPLFFSYLKNSILLLFFCSIIFTAFCLYSNLISNSCFENQECESNIFNHLAIINKANSISYMQMQFFALVIFIFFNFFIMQCLRYEFRKIQQKCDLFVDSPSDYSLMLRRLPDDITVQNINQMIQKRRQSLTPVQTQITSNLKVHKIILSYSLKQYRKIKQKNMNLLKELIQSEKAQSFVPQPYPPFSKSGDMCIIIFQRQESKNFFNYQPNISQKILQCFWSPCIPLSQYQVKGQRISVERAPEPDDIHWQNSNVQISQAIKRKTKFNFFAFGILCLGCLIQYGLALMQNITKDATVSLILSLVTSIVISLSNLGILYFLQFATHRQKNLTEGQYNSVLMVKICFLQFLNAGIFFMIAKFLANPRNFTMQKSLPFQIVLMMIMNALIPNLSVFFVDYFQIVSKLKKYLIQKKFLKPTQFQANLIYQRPTPDIPYKYGYILKTLWLAAFYSPFVPLSSIISMFALIINYLIQKKLFGSVYCSPNMLCSMMNNSAIKLMQLFSLMLTMGTFVIYLYYIHQSTYSMAFAMFMSISLSVLFILLPTQTINKKLFHFQIQNLKSLSYHEVEQNFEVTYQITNPACKINKKRRRNQKAKKVLEFKGKEIKIQLNDLIQDNQQKIIRKVLLQVEQQEKRNKQQNQRYFNQKSKMQEEQNLMLKTLAPQVLQKQAALKRRKLAELQIYNPVINKSDPKAQKNQFIYNFKKLDNQKMRIRNLIGRPFTKMINKANEEELQQMRQL